MHVKFDNIFKLSSTALYWNLGHPSLTFNFKWAAKIFIFMVFYTPCFIAFIYSSIFYDGFSKICTNLSVAVLHSIIVFNYGLLFVYQKRFIFMFKTVEEDLQRSRKLIDEEEIVVRKYTAKGVQAAKFWFTVCILCVGIYFCKAFVGTVYSVIAGNFKPVQIHELTYPTFIEEKKNEFLVYIVLFIFQNFYNVFTAIMYVGFNPLGAIFIMHACGQTTLTIKQLERLFSEKENDVEVNIKKIRNIARLVQHTYSFVAEIQLTHQLLYEVCLKTSTVAIPLAFFGIIESYNEGSLSIDLICYFCACFMQCGSPCFYGEMLLTKGEELRTAIYGCGWERFWVPRCRSTILLMLVRTVRPLGVRAVFCEISRETFSDVKKLLDIMRKKIMKSSFYRKVREHLEGISTMFQREA